MHKSLGSGSSWFGAGHRRKTRRHASGKPTSRPPTLGSSCDRWAILIGEDRRLLGLKPEPFGAGVVVDVGGDSMSDEQFTDVAFVRACTRRQFDGRHLSSLSQGGEQAQPVCEYDQGADAALR